MNVNTYRKGLHKSLLGHSYVMHERDSPTSLQQEPAAHLVNVMRLATGYLLDCWLAPYSVKLNGSAQRSMHSNECQAC